MKFNISQAWLEKHVSKDGDGHDITAGSPDSMEQFIEEFYSEDPIGTPGTTNRFGCYYLKDSDQMQLGDYMKHRGNPNDPWFKGPTYWRPVETYNGKFDRISNYELNTYMVVRPHKNWRHTDEFEPVTPDWLTK